MKELYIIGAGGHGKVAADIAGRTGYDSISFLDQREDLKECSGYPVVGNASLISSLDGDFFVAVGNSDIRKRLFDELNANGKTAASLIHPSAVIGDNVCIGAGSIVAAGAVINPCAVIGTGCIINTCSSIDHDCRIGDFTHVSVGAHIAGTVSIGDGVFVGAGASVINNISICNGVTIGAGAAVIANITEPGTYVGVPARKVK